MLQLDDIPLRVGHIRERDPPRTADWRGHDRSDRAAAGSKDGISRSRHVIHGEGDVGEAGTIGSGDCALHLLIVLEDFQRRAMVSVSGQSQMDAANPRPGHTGAGFESHSPDKSLSGRIGTQPNTLS